MMLDKVMSLWSNSAATSSNTAVAPLVALLVSFVQPILEKMRLEMVIGLERLEIGIPACEWLKAQSSFQLGPLKRDLSQR